MEEICNTIDIVLEIKRIFFEVKLELFLLLIKLLNN